MVGICSTRITSIIEHIKITTWWTFSKVIGLTSVSSKFGIFLIKAIVDFLMRCFGDVRGEEFGDDPSELLESGAGSARSCSNSIVVAISP